MECRASTVMCANVVSHNNGADWAKVLRNQAKSAHEKALASGGSEERGSPRPQRAVPAKQQRWRDEEGAPARSWLSPDKAHGRADIHCFRGHPFAPKKTDGRMRLSWCLRTHVPGCRLEMRPG